MRVFWLESSGCDHFFGMSHLKPFKLTHVLFEKEDPLGEIMAFLTVSPVLVAAAKVLFTAYVFPSPKRYRLSPPDILLISYAVLVCFKMFHPSTNGILSGDWANFRPIDSSTCFKFCLLYITLPEFEGKSARTPED